MKNENQFSYRPFIEGALIVLFALLIFILGLPQYLGYFDEHYFLCTTLTLLLGVIGAGIAAMHLQKIRLHNDKIQKNTKA